MKFLFAFLLVTFNLWAQVSVPASADTLILTHVNVIDTRHGLMLPDMTVVVKDGRIKAVAKLGLISTNHHTQVINASGKYLIPGLWDMHAHSAGPDKPWDANVILPLYLANGITGIRDMGGNPDVLETRRRQVEAGELLGPHMVIAGPFLNGGKSDLNTIAVNTPDEARLAVASLKARKMDFIKILSDISPPVYWAISDESRSQHMRFVGHVPPSVSAAEAASLGQGSIEHLTGVLLASSSKEEELRPRMLAAISTRNSKTYSSLQLEALNTYSTSKAWSLFEKFVDDCTWQVPTLVWAVADANLDNPEITHDPHLKYVPASILRNWTPAKLLPHDPEQLALAKKLTSQNMEMVRSMHRAGVFMLAGSDSPDPYDIPGFSLHDELDLLVKSGFTPMQALQAATFQPALFLTRLDRYGVVEEDHVADLVLLDQDPLIDINNTRKISAVIFGGKYLDRGQLDEMLGQAETAAKND